MKAHVADARFRVICLRIVPKTGSPIYLTHHPRDLVMGGHTYLTTAGYDFTGYAASANFSPGVFELDGIAGLAGIGFDEIASGVFDNARAYLFATTWNSPVEDEEPIVASILGKATLKDQRYTMEDMALIDALNQSVGETYTVACPKTFGGQEYAGCKIDLGPLTVTGTLTSVTSRLIVRDSARAEAADYFAAGTLQFTSGANAGLKPLEIKRHEADGTLEVFEAFHYPPVIGDAYTMIPGCRKRLADCRDKWNNVINFGGFSYIPTGSTYAQVGTK
jgi:uncharacterized phage protein (TIGR02218 family)